MKYRLVDEIDRAFGDVKRQFGDNASSGFAGYFQYMADRPDRICLAVLMNIHGTEAYDANNELLRRVMAQRPYFKKSIKELEALSADAESDPSIIGLLTSELRHRSTQRAQALAKKVSAAEGASNTFKKPEQSGPRAPKATQKPAPPASLRRSI